MSAMQQTKRKPGRPATGRKTKYDPTISIVLRPEQLQGLSKMANDLKISRSKLIRRYINEMLLPVNVELSEYQMKEAQQ